MKIERTYTIPPPYTPPTEIRGKNTPSEVNPLVHGRFSRPIIHGEGHCSPPTTHIENGIKRFVYAHIAYPWNLLENFSFLRVLGLKKALILLWFRDSNFRPPSLASKWYQTIPLYTHSLPLIFWGKNFSFEGARPQDLTFFKNVKTKIFIFENFPKIPSKINSTHPFHPILIPNAPYMKFLLFIFWL